MSAAAGCERVLCSTEASAERLRMQWGTACQQQWRIVVLSQAGKHGMLAEAGMASGTLLACLKCVEVLVPWVGPRSGRL